MNPWGLPASDLLIWGLVLHLVADWPLQNNWMAQNKMLRRQRYNTTTMTGPLGTPYDVWWDRHLAAYVHAGIHGCLLATIFGWVAIPLAIAHLLIDTRKPVIWWSKLVGQSQPTGAKMWDGTMTILLVDVGLEVRFWTDQVFHIVCIAIAALLVA